MVEDLFYFDETSYTGLRRMTDWCSGRQGTTIKARRGDVTGSVTSGKQSYYAVYDGEKLRMAHEVIWELLNGKIPEGFVVDHLDGNGLNNKLSNLRIVTEQWNSHNQKMKSTNTSGKTGVHLKKEKSGYLRWIAQWNDLNSRRMQKSFSVSKYGYDIALKLACEYRLKMIEQLNNSGAGYTERHGT